MPDLKTTAQSEKLHRQLRAELHTTQNLLEPSWSPAAVYSWTAACNFAGMVGVDRQLRLSRALLSLT